MLLQQLITKNIPQLQLNDTVAKAIALMDDFDVKHLCITQKEKYIGIISKDNAYTFDTNLAIENLQEVFTYELVLENEHFTKALAIFNDKKLSLLPVLNSEKDFMGVITMDSIVQQLTQFIGANDKGGIIVMEMEHRNYSFSEISRLIETNDAIIMQLNTHINIETGILYLTVKINKTEISDIIATLQRFEYNIVAYFGEEAYANELEENYNHLLHYLNI